MGGASKPKAPKLPAKLTPSAMVNYKRSLRGYDASRLANGITTGGEIQRENSLFPVAGTYSTSFRRVSTPALRRRTAVA